MLESGLYSQLISITDLSNVIGPRVFPVTPPEDLLANCPCVVMETASYKPSYTANNGSTGFATKRIVLTVYSQYNSGGYATARQIIETIRQYMSGFQGELPDGTVVFQCRIANSQDSFDAEAMLFRCTLHLLLDYQE